MATQEAIKRLRYVFSSEGADKVASDLNKVAAGQAQVAQTSQQTERASLSLDRQFGSIERRFNSTLRAQQDYERVQRQVNAAVQQNPALQQRANEVLRLASDHYGRASQAQTVWSRGLQAANDNAQAFAAGAGQLSGALAGLGPAGLVAAVGIGAFTLAIDKLEREVNDLADRGGKMVDFAETTGLTTTQLQALQKAAAFVGIEADKVGSGFERFSVQLEELRRGSGDLFEAINRIDPALTNQLAATKDAGQAWDIFARALARADRELANVASKAAFGRTGIPFTRLAGATNEAGGIAGLEAGLGRVNVLTTEQLKRWDELKDQIDFTAKTARDNLLSIFADDILNRQLKFYETMLGISQVAKTFTLSDDFKKMLSAAASGVLNNPMTLALVMSARVLRQIGAQQGTAGSSEPPTATFSERFGAFSDRVTTRPEFDAARLRQRIEILGGATSATMRLALAEQELAIKARQAGVSQEDLARGIQALRDENALQQLQRRIALLGDLASVGDIVKAKQIEINQANLQGAGIDRESAKAILERTRLLAEAAKLENQLGFERSQMFRSPTEQRVSETLRSQGIPADSQRGQNVVQMVRFNEQLRTAIDLSSEFATGFVRDMRQGASAIDALTNAVNRLADRLIDMAVNQLVKSALGGLSGLGGIDLGVSTGTGIVGVGPFASAHGNAFQYGNVIPFRRGGVVDQPVIFPMAQGAGLMGEAGPEAVMPLARDSSGNLGVRAQGGGGKVVIQQSVTFQIEGAVSEESIATMIRRGMARATQDAVSIASAAAPGRQERLMKLGT